MIKKALFTLLAFAVVLTTTNLFAWGGGTHKFTVVKTFDFLENYGTENEHWVVKYLKDVYSSNDDLAQIMAQKNFDTDLFNDTEMGGWWIGYRTHMGVAGFSISYTCYWHFLCMQRYGSGHNGNVVDGYSYPSVPNNSAFALDSLIKALFYNQNVTKKYAAGTPIASPENGLSPVDAYKLQSQDGDKKNLTATPDSNYDDFQSVYFEPNINGAAYWISKALENTDLANISDDRIFYLGHALHFAGDANAPQHVWSTSGNNHASYETWLDKNVENNMYQPEVVRTYINEFRKAYNLSDTDLLSDVRVKDILLFYAMKAYKENSAPLFSTNETLRIQGGVIGVNATIATNVLLMQKYLEELSLDSKSRKF